MNKSRKVYQLFYKIWLVLLVIFSHVVFAKSVPSLTQFELVNSELFIFKDDNHTLAINDVLAQFELGKFIKNDESQVSFGFTKSIIWAVLPITNTSDNDQRLILKVENAWLDELDVFFYQQNVLSKKVKLGDTSSFHNRERQKRMPSVAFTFKPGVTHVVLRIKSDDPMTFPVYLGDEKSVDQFEQENSYFYGALYGALIILLIYNLMLYAYSKELRYCFYSLYLLSFTVFNFTYTGHGFWLLWPNNVLLQQYLMPLLMFGYLFSGVLFTMEYLQVQKYLPRLYSYRRFIYGGLVTLGCIIIAVGSISFAVMSQLVVLTTISVWMLAIGYYSLINGNHLAKFFVPAVLMGAFGATISSLTTWGVFPYTQWAFRGIELGMLLEMSLLSISIGFNFKMAYDARVTAEHYARIDSLTNLFNRRALTELIYPIWNLGKRQHTSMSVMLIDLDWFKRINDEFGHIMGDDVLKHVAHTLKRSFRQSDIIIRWGGEEFFVFLPDTDIVQAKRLAEKLRDYFDKNKVNDVTRITISVGVACSYPSVMSFDELIELADKSLYHAKQNGRNQVVTAGELSPDVI